MGGSCDSGLGQSCPEGGVGVGRWCQREGTCWCSSEGHSAARIRGASQPTHSRAHSRIIPYKDLNRPGGPAPSPRPGPAPFRRVDEVMRLRDWSEGRAPSAQEGETALYYSGARQRRRVGSWRALGRLLLLLFQLLRQLPLLDPERAAALGVVRQRRGSLAAIRPVPPGTRRAARPRPKLPCTAG